MEPKTPRALPRRSRSGQDLHEAMSHGDLDNFFASPRVVAAARKSGPRGPRSVASTPVRARRRRGSGVKIGAKTTDEVPSHEEDSDIDSEDEDASQPMESIGQMDESQNLQLQVNRTDNLLFQVFPRHIAEALRDGRKVEPEHHDMVTIFFSDIVGFTDISATLDPIKISDMLDR